MKSDINDELLPILKDGTKNKSGTICRNNKFKQLKKIEYSIFF